MTFQGSTIIGQGTNATNTIVWNNGTPGAYSLLAVAYDSAGRITASPAVRLVLQTQGQNHVPLAMPDTPTVVKNSANNILDVLANDTDVDLDALTITNVVFSTNATVEIVNNGKAVRYTPRRGGSGSDAFTYQITDGKGGVSSAFVLVTIQDTDLPSVSITAPVNDTIVDASSNLTLTASVGSWQNVTNLEFFIGDVRIAQMTNITSGTPSTNWLAVLLNCDCGLYARVTDRFGQVAYSSYVSLRVRPPTVAGEAPVAKFDNLTAEVKKDGNLTQTNLATIREGIFDVIGRAYDNDSTNDAWRLELRTASGEFLRDFTPGPLDVMGFRAGAVGSSTTSNLLATCDLTTVQNGTYELVLKSRDSFRVTEARFRFRLESELKIGQFSFSEQDLAIPVNGLPLTVVRTYNSQNPKSGDFGYGWTYSILGMEIELDEERIPVRDIDGSPLSLRVGGGRNVTVTLPGGRRATFAFNYVSGGGYRLLPDYTAPPGINAKLEVKGYHPLDSLSLRWLNDGGTSYEWYEFPGYTLTLEDGTQYVIERGPGEDFFPFTNEDDDEAFDATVSGEYSVKTYAAPYLSKIIQRSGDTIEIERPQFGGGNQTFRILHKDALGNLTRSIFFERDAQGRIKSVRDPIGGSAGVPSVKYQYDSAGNLSQVLRLVDRAAGRYLTNTYLYENASFPHYITTIKDARGYSVARNLYDDAGRLIGIVDAFGRTNRMEHDITGRREVLFDKKGAASYHYYDPRGNVTNSVNALGQTNLFLYNTNGYLLAQTDPLGNVTTYSNDANGNVLSVTLPYPVGADPAKYTTRFTYDAFGQQLTVALPSGAVQTNKYDAAGNLTGTTDENGNPIFSAAYANGLQVAEGDKFGTNFFAYDALGNVRFLTNSLGKVTTSDYDANGNLTHLVDGANESTVQYDALGREAVADYGDGITLSNNYNSQLDWNNVSGPTIGSMERRFDEQGRLAGWRTANNSTPGFAYDENGRLQFETNSIGQVTHTTYDAAGRAVAVTNLTTGAGAASFYDAAGRRIYQEDALGRGTWLGFNPDGSLAATTNALGYFWQFSYDVGGACCGGGGASSTTTDPFGRQVTEQRSPQGLLQQRTRRSGTNVLTMTMTYLAGLVSPDQEAEEYPATVTDEGGRVRQFGYTTLGQLERATDLGGNWFTNQYDADSGALTNVLGPTGERLAYVYDDLDNVKAVGFGDGNWLTNFYSTGTNRLTGVRFPSGATNALAYDSAGRLAGKVSSIGETASFTYNANDAVTTMTDNTGTTTNLFDGAGRLYGLNYPFGATVRYGFDLLGRVTAMTNRASANGSNWITRYSYDALGNITNVNALGQDTRYEYDRVGRRTKRVLPNGVITDWQYDWRDYVTNLVHKRFSDGQVLVSFGYVRANGGEPTRITREDGSYVELKYDGALRLTNEVYRTSGGSLVEEIAYGYDAAGNRTRFLKAGVTLTNAVSGGYRITALKNAASGATAESFAYDNGGRVTYIERGSITNRLGYNTADQLTAVTNGAAWVNYTHDAAGRRTLSTNSTSVVRRFVTAGTPETDLESPLLITDQSGNVQQGFVYLGRHPLLRFDATGTPVYYLEDAMGSIVALATTSGTTNASFNYDGFGNLRSAGGSTNVPTGTEGDFRFHGAWWEKGTDLHHMRAREYDQRAGRFVSRDMVYGSVQGPETLHAYAYANGNPHLFTDPAGLFSIIEINIGTSLQTGMQAFRAAAINRGKNYAKKKIGEFLTDQFFSILRGFIPIEPRMLREFGSRHAGFRFSKFAEEFLCDELDLPDSIWFEPQVRRAGSIVSNGLTCGSRGSQRTPIGPYPLVPRPDVIISPLPPLDPTGRHSSAYLIGEIKLSGQSLYRAYLSPKSQGNQLEAILNYARSHTIPRVAVFGTFLKPNQNQANALKINLTREAIQHGVVIFVVSVQK